MISLKTSNYSTFLVRLYGCRSFSNTLVWKNLDIPDVAHRLGHQVSLIRHYSDKSGTAGLSSNTLMEIIKAAHKRSSNLHNHVAIRADSNNYSYIQLISSALKISNLLIKAQNGCIEKGRKYLDGARVGIVAKPSAEFVAGILGTWLCRGVAVPLALSYPESELAYVLHDSDISFVLGTEDQRQTLENVSSNQGAQFYMFPRVPSIQTKKNEDVAGTLELDDVNTLWEDINSIEAKGDDPALILYTSGTTGKPKGVLHTQGSIIAQVQTLTEAWEYTPDDEVLHCLPLHHVHGLFNALLAPLYAGSLVDFMPKFSVRGIWQKWRDSYPKNGSKVNDAITVFTGVPTMYTRLLQGYEAMDPEMQLSSALAARRLRLMMCGSSALPYPVMKQWEDITGHRLLERYGMTEFVMAISNPLKGVRKAGTVGKPFPGVQVEILEVVENGSTPTGVGELCVKSPSMFKEYWRRPEVTKESFTDGGFFKTGDTAKVDDDGYYIILGRTNADIMKVGGYKLSALEIEAVLLEHPAILECCVLGLPDKDYGEVVCTVVVPEEAAKKFAKDLKPVLSLEELQIWAKERLAPYKIPTKLFLWETLPRNAMGKVNKIELKKLLEG